MSPEITIISETSKEVINVPDRTGVYTTIFGKVSVNMSRVAPARQEQLIEVGGAGLGLLRSGEKKEISLSPQGFGSIRNGSYDRIEVKLHNQVRDNSKWRRQRVGYYITKSEDRHTVYRWVPKDPRHCKK